MDSGKASLHAVVSGRVQGVFYRMFVLQEASRLSLSGRVLNLRDGRVRVVAEGERKSLEHLLQRLHKGPSGARVADVRAEWGEYRHEYPDFQIEYS